MRSLRESESLSEICSTASTPTLAAASSMASGMPSSRRQISRHRPRVLGRQREGRRTVERPLHEQPRRPVAFELLDRRRSPGVGQGEGRYRPVELAGDAQRLAARGQYPKVRARAQELVHQPRHGIHEVLAVVQDRAAFAWAARHPRACEPAVGRDAPAHPEPRLPPGRPAPARRAARAPPATPRPGTPRSGLGPPRAPAASCPSLPCP